MEEKKEVTIQEIQSKLLEILLYFQKFCQENGLGFVLAGGTCLGAVRHKGFIPWDDDVDVFMLRDDYEKLCRIWDEKADTEHYSCVRSNDRFNIRHSATEIKDNNTTFINRHSVDLDIHQGLMIDVIPLDAVPKSKWKQLWQMVDSMMYCCFNFQRLPAHKGKVTYYAEKLALTLVPSFKARYKLWKGAEKRLSRYSLADAEYVSSFGEGATIMRQRFPIRWFRHPAYLEFEGHQMPVPEDYDKWLTISYGDYMQLLPRRSGSTATMRYSSIWSTATSSIRASTTVWMKRKRESHVEAEKYVLHPEVYADRTGDGDDARADAGGTEGAAGVLSGDHQGHRSGVSGARPVLYGRRRYGLGFRAPQGLYPLGRRRGYPHAP